MDKIAQVQQTMDFDPWGARRNTNWDAMSSTELTNTFFKNHSVSNSVGTTALTSRGFTGHEMLDEVGVIHMNGRIYDAKLGRFLQADPIIQEPYITQSLNRYSYVWNNPLNSTDPSGYFGFIGGFIIAKILIALDLEFLIPVVNIAGCLMGGIPGSIGTAAGTTYATTGDFGEAIEQGAIAGISAAAFQSVGDFFGEVASANATAVSNGALQTAQVLENGLTFAQTVGKIATHAAVGGVMSVMQGGKFGHGFASAGFTQGLSGKIGSIGLNDAVGRFIRVTAAAVVGGTASKLTGGKFANGALTGAFSRLFNDEGHEGREDKQLSKANVLEVDGEFRFARNSALSTAKAFGRLQEEDFGVIIKNDKTFFESFTNSEALTDIPDNKYSLTEAFNRTAYNPVQPELNGYIHSPAPIQDAIAVGIYRHSNSSVVNYNNYSRSINAPVYVQSRGGGCIVYGSSSSRGC